VGINNSSQQGAVESLPSLSVTAEPNKNRDRIAAVPKIWLHQRLHQPLTFREIRSQRLSHYWQFRLTPTSQTYSTLKP
jgi:hypothetical protein